MLTPMEAMKKPAAEADGGVEHGAARAGPFEPRAEERGGDAEEGDGDGEDVADLFEVPGGAVGGVEGEEGVFEDGEGVDLADGEMDGEGGGRDEPAAVSGRSDGTVPVEKGKSHSRNSWETRVVRAIQAA